MTGLCFACFDPKFFMVLHFSPSPNYYLSASLSVYLSVCHLHFLSKRKMREILLDAQDFVARWQQADPTKKKTWADRQTLLNESWAQSHAEIFNFFLQSTFAVPDDAMCERCLNEVAVVKMPGMLSLTTFLQWL